MFRPTFPILIVLVASGIVSAHVQAQAPTVARPLHVQPGLENAVKWKWWVLPTEESDWGLPLRETIHEPEVVAKVEPAKATTAPLPAAILIPPGNYEVKRGDALVIIARKAGISLSQLKSFNALSNDIIRIGQVLKIPTLDELAALTPPPLPAQNPQNLHPQNLKVSTAPESSTASKKGKKLVAKAPILPEINQEAEATLILAFLDRENFSTGPIDGNQGANLEKLLALYRTAHQDLQTAEALRAKAITVVGEPFTHYQLKPSDFRFIAAPRAASAPLNLAPASKGAKSSKTNKSAPAPKEPPRAPVTYEELTTATFSAYQTPWELVAERFHCDEAFLRNLNLQIKGTPTAGTDFKVPNVIPFEIENCFALPLQPPADPDQPVAAAIVEMSRLEIRKSGQLIAILPMSRARPDLRGKGSWTILDAIPGPRLATRQESTNPPKFSEPSLLTGAPESQSAITLPAITPAPTPLTVDQTLAAGPRNPVGIIWVNLAKSKSTTPLPYGLHGTSIPSRMKTQESIGGLRLTNWDIARAVRMLPSGTPLKWQ